MKTTRFYTTILMGICVLLFAWMFINSGNYEHKLEGRLMVDQSDFGCSVYSGGSDVRVISKNNQMTLKTDSENLEDGGSILQVKGKLTGQDQKFPAEVIFEAYCEDDSEKGHWKIVPAEGTRIVKTGEWESANFSKYLWLAAIAIFLVLFLLKSMGNHFIAGRKYAKRMLKEIRQDQEAEQCWQDAMKWWRRYHAQWLGISYGFISILLMLVFVYLYKYSIHSLSYVQLVGFAGILIVLGVAFSFYRQVWMKEYDRILQEYSRPFTAGVAFLMVAAKRNTGQNEKHVAYYIQMAAEAFERAGDYERALELTQLSARLKTNKFFNFRRKYIRYEAFYGLGRMKESDHEKQLMREMVDKKPGLLKKKPVEMALSKVQIREAMDCEDYNKALAGIEQVFEQCIEEEQKVELLYLKARILEKHGVNKEAEKLYRNVLEYSPENSIVRKAETYGKCSWNKGKVKTVGIFQVFIHIISGVIIIALLGSAIMINMANDRLGKTRINYEIHIEAENVPQ